MSLDQTISASGAENRQQGNDGELELYRLAFETAPQATLRLDRNLTVTSANQAARTLLASSGAELEARIPGLVFGALSGTPLRPLFSTAGEIGEYRGGTWQVKSAESIWEFIWTPITVQGGGSLGGTLVIQDMTRSLKALGQANSLHSMIDGASTYFMMCDNNLCITYVNPAVKAMFRKYQQDIRRYLPTFDVDRLIGQNIDQFHRSPEHQRRLLANPALLPVTSEVKIGELEFGVTANLLSDAAGAPIGIGVEWSDRNDYARYRREVDAVIGSIREGQLSHRGDVSQLNAVYAPMMTGINSILDAIIDPITVARDALRKISEQDLTVRITQDYSGDHAIIKRNLNKAMETLEGAIIQVSQSVHQVSRASGQIADGAKKIADGANQQASSIEEISSSLEEMSSMVAQNADNAEQARGLARMAQNAAEKGSGAMTRMVEAIGRIKTSSDQTSKIIKTIDEIAFQTNLLALNAAVEAARAGDAGKGFAVVAEEVRNLAQRSAEAARNTADMIEESVRNAEGGVRISDEVSAVLSEILDSNTKVNNLITEIAAASKEQSDGVRQINEAVVTMDRVTQENAANSEQSASASQHLNEQVHSLRSMVSRFRTSAPPVRDSAPQGSGNRAQATTGRFQPQAAPQARPAAQPSALRRPAAAPAAEAVFPLDNDDDFGDF